MTVCALALRSLLAIGLAASAAAPCLAESPTTATQTIDTMNKLWGRHPGIRANHAKGVVVTGSFTPTPAAKALSKAAIFAGGSVPVTVRFSDSSGLPALPDGAPGANPHGMAIKFQPAAGGTVDVVTNSLPFFPVATGEDFLALLQALSVSGPGTPKPTAADTFMAAHPAAPRAFGALGTPSSFAREAYNGIDAFMFVNAAGKRQPFRFKLVPVAGVEHLAPADAAKRPPDFLMEELPARLKTQTAAFRLMAQLAEPGDQTRDPTLPWPAGRKMADLGTITLTKAVADNVLAQKQLHYLPNQLEPGIELSDDPLVGARVRAYVISFGRRA
jgi:catalase